MILPREKRRGRNVGDNLKIAIKHILQQSLLHGLTVDFPSLAYTLWYVEMLI